jgi:branched-chain amino acid aminotransferase
MEAVGSRAEPKPGTETTERFAVGAALVDGEIVSIGEARVPITDMGFSRSDVTYDVVAVWGGAFFRLDDHIERFRRSCERLRLDPGVNDEGLRDKLIEIVATTRLRDAYVDVICTRGVPEQGTRDPRRVQNRLYAYAIPYVWVLPWEERDSGMDVIIARKVERISPTAVDPTVKNFHWGDLTQGLYEAYDRGARFPVLLDSHGHVTEGPGYNVFALVDGILLTPATGVLEGITRRTVIELAREQGIDVRETVVDVATFRRGTELFATSTAGGVMAITSLDGRPIGDGTVGTLTRRIRDHYWAAHADPRYTTPITYA